MPDDKVRSYDLGLTLSYPYSTLYTSVPVPRNAGAPGGVYTSTGEGKESQGDFKPTFPTLRLSFVPGTLQTTKDDSRDALVRYGAYFEFSQWQFRQTATTRIGQPTTSRLEADGMHFAFGAYLRSAYLLSSFTEKESIPPWLHIGRIEFLAGGGIVPITTRVLQPSGGVDEADAVIFTIDSNLRVIPIGFDTGPVHINFAHEFTARVQGAQISNGGTRDAHYVIFPGVAITADGEF